jgi:uncharacterized integral membrane protein (TIGR00698 family)
MPFLLPRLRAIFPGVLLSLALALAASFVATTQGGPAVLYALLLGMAFHFLASDARFAEGIAFSSRSILRLGVALLGGRITLEQISALGWHSLVGIAAAVVITLCAGVLAARVLGLRQRFGILSAGATAICGASAAAAISAVLPRYPNHERDTAFTIIGVTTLSTVAMVLYPVLARLFGFDTTDTGIFLGGTIHDVAQVVGAGYSVGHETGDTATIIKLWRVALLVPTVVGIALLVRFIPPSETLDDDGTAAKTPPLVPMFLVGFIAIVMVNSLGFVPAPVSALMGDASRWCITLSIAALGVKTSLQALSKVGGRAVGLMVFETVLLLILVVILLKYV